MGVTRASRRLYGEAGQATIELVVVFPVLLAVAFIVMNATLFLSECASFDRMVPQAVRVHAASPSYGQDAQQAKSLIESQLQEEFDKENLSVSVAVRTVSGGMLRFDATLEFAPTLFGLGMRSEFFGVALPKLSHTASLTVDRYKPGVVI
ncbi:MAG TPA: hypothetical protein IAC28_05020 [Candidatus Aphodovivens excrementavium]|nr:hypothetical protein [Candidatus Aphodovivens excrementavium]